MYGVLKNPLLRAVESAVAGGIQAINRTSYNTPPALSRSESHLPSFLTTQYFPKATTPYPKLSIVTKLLPGI
ncbi:hypothetical protein LX99_03547 [Mucilaginibacter oryzae]|uniref:Uncharacterized protein n=1 Tax=Mucilaginibacter oryzae TaxID=468058 RepID=A0A316H5T6_9SPHI|nr:hypothetical protein LX99_03547 [Mucilaginibacter oryzae]